MDMQKGQRNEGFCPAAWNGHNGEQLTHGLEFILLLLSVGNLSAVKLNSQTGLPEFPKYLEMCASASCHIPASVLNVLRNNNSSDTNIFSKMEKK